MGTIPPFSPYWPDDEHSSSLRPLPTLDEEFEPVSIGAPRPVRTGRVRLGVAVLLVLVGAAAVWVPGAHEQYVLEEVSVSATPLVWEVSCTTPVERHRGTGFVLEGAQGPFVLTNWHVVQECRGQGQVPAGVIEVGRPGAAPRPAVLVEHFGKVDAAFLSSGELPSGLRRGPAPSVGDAVAVVGHPGDSRDVAVSGRVTEVEGASFIVAVGVERGSSGSPALDSEGRAVGLVSAKLVGGFREAAQVFSLESVCALASSC